MVVSSRDAALQPSLVEPPSQRPAKAAMDLAALKYIRRSVSREAPGTQRCSSQSAHTSGLSSTITFPLKFGNALLKPHGNIYYIL